MSAPRAILIAGANGSGKTTFARQMLPLLHPEATFINADEIQRQGGKFASDVAASREFLRRLDVVAVLEESFAVETTLASRSYVPHIARWRAEGYRTVLHFIEVPSADFAVERVRQRVQNGGHDIPEADIRRRFERGRDLFDRVYKGSVHEWHHWTSDEQGFRLHDSWDPNDA